MGDKEKMNCNIRGSVYDLIRIQNTIDKATKVAKTIAPDDLDVQITIYADASKDDKIGVSFKYTL